jgi:hypothetical protein
MAVTSPGRKGGVKTPPNSFCASRDEKRSVIVVSTGNFELYHELVGELRDRDATFTTVNPGEGIPDTATAVVVGPHDPDPTEGVGDPRDVPTLVRATPGNARAAVSDALAAGTSGRRTIGIDPGAKPGIAVLDGGEVTAAFQVPESDVAAVVASEIEARPDAVVRIGDGARLRGSRIVDDLDVAVELVPEERTTPHLGTGARGMGDVLAAVNIARREGEPITERSVDPTEGEIRTIKEQARERSGDRTLPDALARKVADGDLTMEEALERHRDR